MHCYKNLRCYRVMWMRQFAQVDLLGWLMSENVSRIVRFLKEEKQVSVFDRPTTMVRGNFEELSE